MNLFSCNFCQGQENESSLLQARVGDSQTIIINHQIIIKDDVQVYGTRAVPEGFSSAHTLLNPFEKRKQLPGRKFRFQGTGDIYKFRLFNMTYRFCFIE
ncbi:hypothetical protein ES707_22089 [subsurface metagenome]